MAAHYGAMQVTSTRHKQLKKSLSQERSTIAGLRVACAVPLSCLALLCLASLPVPARASNAALETTTLSGTAADKAQGNEFYATFPAITLRPNPDLTGTAVIVLKAAAWVLPTDTNDPPTAYKVRLVKWSCAKNDPNCPTQPVPVYYVSNADFVADKSLSLAITTGVLAVPFKYHFSDQALTTGSTIGGYIGLRQDLGFTQLSEVLGGGLALVSSTAATSNFTPSNSSTIRYMGRPAFSTTAAATSASGASNANPSTSTLTGLSLATGLLGKLGGTNTQFGFLIGIDMVEKSASYKYNGKPWLSLSVGYAFSN